MNIAFSTIVLFLLMLPGVIFRRIYYTGDFSRKHIVKSPLDIFIDSIIPGVLFQIIGVMFICLLLPSKYHVNFGEFSYLIVGAKEDKNLSMVFKDIERSFHLILLYSLTICFIAGLSGYFYRNVVRKHKIDLRYRYFRFPNDWFYILNGEVLQFPDNTLEHKKFDFICLDVLTKTVNESIIYSGRLKLWYLEQGSLASIVIDNVSRRVMSDGHDQKEINREQGAYFNIPGDFIVILCKEIININVRYIRFEDLLEAQPSNEEDIVQ